MQIQNIYNYQNSYNYTNLNKSPNFKAWERTVYEGSGRYVKNSNFTYFFRDHELFASLVKFIATKFRNFSKVNVYSLGCSDGSEPLSLIMQTLTSKQEGVLKKISPIIARDIDPVAIEKAQSNNFEMYHMEKKVVENSIGKKYRKFFIEPSGSPKIGEKIPVYLKSELYRHVDFAVGDVNNEIEKINPSEANIVMIRNMITYMGTRGNWANQEAFFEKLYNQLGENSYIVLGDYDFGRMGAPLYRILRKAGFAKTEIPKLYRRKTEAEKAVPMTFIEKIKENFEICLGYLKYS